MLQGELEAKSAKARPTNPVNLSVTVNGGHSCQNNLFRAGFLFYWAFQLFLVLHYLMLYMLKIHRDLLKTLKVLKRSL
jgi:hypothetical protein